MRRSPMHVPRACASIRSAPTFAPTCGGILTPCRCRLSQQALKRVAGSPSPDDPYLWLEEVHGERALAWVRERNTASQAELMARAEYAPTRAQLLEVLNAKDRIPYFTRRGDWLY